MIHWGLRIHWSGAFLAFCLGVMLMALLEVVASHD